MATLTPDELAERRARLAALNKVRGTGLLSIQHEGRRLQYQTGEALDAAIAKLEAEIRGATCPRPRRMFRLYQSGNGL